MKIDRAEVEGMLAECADYDAVAVDSPLLADLCRLALEVMDAPVARINGELELYALEPSDGDSYVAIGKLEGQRVRLVRVGDGGVCIGGGK